MYFVLNQEETIIALDDAALKLFHAKNIMELYQKLTNGTVEFYIEDDTLAIVSAIASKLYKIDEIAINGLLGNGKLIVIQENATTKENIQTNTNDDKSIQISQEPKIEPTIEALVEPKIEPTIEPLPAEDIAIDVVETASEDLTVKQQEIQATQPNDDDNENKELLDLLNRHNEKSIVEKPAIELTPPKIEIPKPKLDIVQPVEVANIPLEIEKPAHTVDDLVIVDNHINTTDTIKVEAKPDTMTIEEPYLNLKSSSEKIGLSEVDYKNFFSEYIQTANMLKKDLTSDDIKARENALDIMIHLASTLYAPSVVTERLNDIKASASNENIDKLYETFALISKELNQPIQLTDTKLQDTIIDNKVDLVNEPIKLEIQEPAEQTIPTPKITISEPTIVRSKPATQSAIGEEINLDGVAPERFEFSIQKSSEELSLPQEIVKDFMKDFTLQCRTETDNIISAYKAGDMDTIKRISHSLKGVASNLYLTPLAESLLHLQHNKELASVPSLLKKYWALFISYENQIKNM